MIRDYGLQLYFETSAKTGENIDQVFKETTSFMYLKYTSIKLGSQYMVPPKPIIIRKSVVLFLLGVLCYFWLIFTSENTKIKSLLFSLLYEILDYFLLHDFIKKKKEIQSPCLRYFKQERRKIVIFFFPHIIFYSFNQKSIILKFSV